MSLELFDQCLTVSKKLDRMQFTKLFSSILDSTIWQEPPQTKILWITMLAMADRNGQVHASIPGLARRAGISLQECESAIACLMAPDPYSRTKDHEGRRICVIDGGWALLNHAKYRTLLSFEERREYNRRKQAEHRAKKSASITVIDSQSQSAKSAHTEAEAEAEAEAEVESKPSSCPDSAKPSHDGPKDAKPDLHVNPEAERFVDWFLALLDETGGVRPKLTKSNRYLWADTYDKLLRIDGKTKDEVKEVCRWARNDAFWQSNFMAPPKLRAKKDGVSYFDVFRNKMKSARPAEQQPMLVPLPKDAY